MKKKLIIILLFSIIIILIKYYYSDYKLDYTVDNYEIINIYRDKRLYFELNGKYSFNFDVYQKRRLKKQMITSIKEISGDGFYCIYPVIDKISTYPLCIQNEVITDYHLINNDMLNDYKREKVDIEKTDGDFKYYNNIDENTYISLWNYKGYTFMNEKFYKNVNIFKTGQYDNSLAYKKDKYIYMPDYDQEHEFNKIIVYNMETGDYEKVAIGYKIDYNSYVVGCVEDSIFIYDMKNSVLYEYSINRKELSIKGNIAIGFAKYENGEFVACSKREYNINKITFDNKDSKYKYQFKNQIMYKNIKENTKITSQIIFGDITKVGEYNNVLYYVMDDYMYKYTPENGQEKIFYSFELNFNKDNTIFIHNK